MPDKAKKLNADRLIDEIQRRPPLWDQWNISYQNREITDGHWNEIAGIFKLPKQFLKTKWKGLRDTFRAEMKKEEAYKSTKQKGRRQTWIHFRRLSFLKNQMSSRPPLWSNSLQNSSKKQINESLFARGHIEEKSFPTAAHQEPEVNIIIKEEDDITCDSVEIEEDDCETLSSFNATAQDLSPEQVSMDPIDINHSNTETNDSEDNLNDGNYYFLMSLLPHMRKLPPDQAMLLRMELQEIVYKAVYKKSTR